MITSSKSFSLFSLWFFWFVCSSRLSSICWLPRPAILVPLRDDVYRYIFYLYPLGDKDLISLILVPTGDIGLFVYLNGDAANVPSLYYYYYLYYCWDKRKSLAALRLLTTCLLGRSVNYAVFGLLVFYWRLLNPFESSILSKSKQIISDSRRSLFIW